MSTSREERDRILTLVEIGQVTALQAAQLLDTLEIESPHPTERSRERIIRLCTSNGQSKPPKQFSASLSVSLLKSCLRLGTNLLPQLSYRTLQDLLLSIEKEQSGRILDLQDLEKGERLEIFIE